MKPSLKDLMDARDLRLSLYQLKVPRECEVCGIPYTIDTWSSATWAMGPSIRNRSLCDRMCLPCTLGVGPTDFPEEFPEPDPADKEAYADWLFRIELARESINRLQIGPDYMEWTVDRVMTSNKKWCIRSAFEFYLDQGVPLVAMPLSQACSDVAVHYLHAIIYYPPGTADFEGLDCLDESIDPDAPDVISSAAAGANMENLLKHGLLVFPATFDAELIAGATHAVHLELIRRLSEEVDKVCLDFVRYYTCSLSRHETIPARAGQTQTDPAMSICFVHDPCSGKSRIYGGAAFSFAFTGGIGIWLSQPEWPSFPGNGEVGKIVYHALRLYAAMLESSSDTSRFVQAMSLLEFLAFPHDYTKMMEVKKVIARYVADDPDSYQHVLDRFRELTGHKDPTTGEEIGLRTRVIHIGDRIESLIPDPRKRRDLFDELDRYIRAVLDHMIEHSDMDFPEYLECRKSFPAFLANGGP